MLEGCIAKIPKTIAILDQRDVPPPLPPGPVSIQRQDGMLIELSSKRVDDLWWDRARTLRKNPKKADCPKLQRKAEAVMSTTQFSNDRPITLVEMEASRDVIVINHIRKSAIPRAQNITPEARWHSQISEVLRDKIVARKIKGLAVAKHMCEKKQFCNKICNDLECAA